MRLSGLNLFQSTFSLSLASTSETRSKPELDNVSACSRSFGSFTKSNEKVNPLLTPPRQIFN